MSHAQTTIVATLALWLGVSAFIVALLESYEIDHLNGRVSCLEHPHAESSIAGRFVGTGSSRRFVVTQPAHRTGCTP